MRRLVDVVVAGAGARGHRAAGAASRCSPSGWSRPGHPIYRQRRVGRDGAEFDMLKLRTMVCGAENIGAGMAVNEGDARITRVGRFLRRYSIDELPNLVNVLRGEMSLIGPRPTIQVQVAQYTERQRGRLAIKPGLTGWAQIHGRDVAALGRAHRARPLVHRAPPLAGRRARSSGGRSGCSSTATASTRARRAAGRIPRHERLGGDADGGGQALRHRQRVRPARAAGRLRPQPAGPGRSTPRPHRYAPPRIDDPGYVPFLAELCERHDVGAVVPLTDLDIEVLAARARRRPAARAGARRRRSPPRPTTSTRRTCCSSASGCRRRRRCSRARSPRPTR